MQREPRGSLYHPHLREEIPLSTESVARYRRPFWTFGNDCSTSRRPARSRT